MGKSELDHRGETVGGVFSNAQESFLFGLKASAEVSEVNCNPSVKVLWWCFGAPFRSLRF